VEIDAGEVRSLPREPAFSEGTGDRRREAAPAVADFPLFQPTKIFYP
jgi:hypothetical protein